MTELLVVVTFMGLTALIAADSYSRRASRLQAAEAARTLKTVVHRARMDAIYTGLNQYVVVSPDDHRIQIREDSGSTSGEFDSDDPVIFSEHWSAGAEIRFPEGESSMSHPTGGTAASDPWSMPTPDSSAAWGTDLIGFTMTPRGLVESAEATPTTINSGVAYFTNQKSLVSAVVIRGRMGTVDSYELVDGAWRKM
jgi:hypothetical protein